jgi:maltooligosyltrehalose synthase
MRTSSYGEHVISFARRYESQWAIVAVPRHFYHSTKGEVARSGGTPRADRAGTQIVLPDEAPASWRCEFSGRRFEVNGGTSDAVLETVDLFGSFPVALLTADST